MTIDIILATFNRAAILEEALTCYLQIQPPGGRWRLILADNGSTDETPTVVNRFCSKLPIEYIHEGRPGKTMAVNAALARASADLILFTDDDILPTPGWLMHYELAAEQHPGYDIFGGPVTLKWPSPPEPWMISSHAIEGDCFAATNPSHVSGPHQGAVVGGNFAVRRRAIEGAGFDPAMGPQGHAASFPQGNEAEFLQRLLAKGCKVWWIGEAAVQHIVRQEQMSKRWMWARAVRAGRGHFRLDVARLGMPRRIAGLPRYVVADLARRAWRLLRSYLGRNEIEQFESRYFLHYAWGKLLESRRMSAAANRRATAGAPSIRD